MVSIVSTQTPAIDDGCDISSIDQMYGKDHCSVTQLFPDEENGGCINFGYWPLKENMELPISLVRRIESQKNLYFHLFQEAGLSNQDKVLEVGSGRGHGVNWGSRLVQDYQGVDLLEEQVKKAQRIYPGISDHYSIGSADNLPFKAQTFDKVVCMEASQHFPNFPAFVKEANRVLVQDGTIALSTFFYLGENGEKECRKVMPSNELALDQAIQLDQAVSDLEASGFKVKAMTSIGKRTFHGFCSWAEQVNVTTPHTLRWASLYDAGHMDYVTIVAKKVSE